jgi:hypothetical protein
MGARCVSALYCMHYRQELRRSEDPDSGVSAISGTLLMVALTVVLASVVFYLVLSVSTPQNFTRTGMRMFAFNSSTLGVTSMIGDSISIENIHIIVGSETYNASGIRDDNNNGFWDPGETIFLYGLELTRPTSVVVTTGTTVLMPSTVQWSNNPAPSSPGTPDGNTFTAYMPGIRMTTYSDPSFVSPVSAKVTDNITYAAAAGYRTNDQAWPQSEAGRAHNFSVEFEGKLYIGDNDTYVLYIMATDSVYLAVDGNMIVEVTGSHGASVYHGQMFLTAGYHDLVVGYKNYYSDAVIGEFYLQEGSTETMTPPGLFYLESRNA